MRSAATLLCAFLAFSLSIAGCADVDPRDRPLSELNALDSATREKALATLTEQERAHVMNAAKAYGADSNALNKRTINQLIDEGEALERNKPMYSK